MLRGEYQETILHLAETILHLAETDLEIELLYLGRCVEEVRRMERGERDGRRGKRGKGVGKASTF